MGVVTGSGETSRGTGKDRWLGAGLVALLATTGVASAQTVTVTNNNVTSSAGAGFTLLNLGSATSGYVTSSTLTPGSGLPTVAGSEITQVVFADSGTDTNKSGVYAGNTANVATSPMLSPSSGATTGSQLEFFAAQGNSADVGTVTVSYSVAQDALRILWGTVGTGDTLTACGNTSCSSTLWSITGSTLISDGAVSNQNASVRITGIPAFTTLRLSDNNSNPAFEFLLGQPAPEPASLAVLITGLAGLRVVRRRKDGV